MGAQVGLFDFSYMQFDADIAGCESDGHIQVWNQDQYSKAKRDHSGVARRSRGVGFGLQDGSLAGRSRAARRGLKTPCDGLRPRSLDFAEGFEHGAGEPRMAACAPPEMNDRVLVPDRRDRLDDVRRRKPREFVIEWLPRWGHRVARARLSRDGGSRPKGREGPRGDGRRQRLTWP